MTGNYVEIKVKATDTARPDLTDLRAQLDELGAKVENAKVDVDDADGRAKLLDLNAKLAAIGAKVANPKLSLSGAARVEAQLAAVDLGLDHLNDKSGESESRLGALGSAFNDLTLGISSGWGEMSMFQKVMLGLNVATGIGEPLVAGLTVAVGGLTSGLAAAGAGLGVFGAVAKSVWSGVSSNISAAAAAQEKIARGATGKNLIADNKALLASLKGLSAGQRSLVLGASNAELSWHKFVAHSAAGVSSVLVPALNLVPKALSLAKGFLGPVEGALRNVVAYVSKGLNSQGFGSFIKMLQQNAGPMIEKLAHAIGNVAKGIGGIIEAFMPMAQKMGTGLDSLTAKFAKWGTTLTGHSGFQSLMSMFRSETPMAVHALGQLATLIKTVVANMTGMSTFSNSKMLLQGLDLLLPVLNKLAKVPGLVDLILYLKLAAGAAGKLKTAFTGISSVFGVFKSGASALQDFNAGMSNSAAAASDATGAWGTFGGAISKIGSSIASAGSSVASFVAQYAAKMGQAIAATGAWIAEHAVAAGTFIAENVAMAASATAAFIAENAATLGLVAGIAALVAGIVYLATHWKQVWGAVKAVIRDAVDFIKAHWKLLPAIFLGPLGIVTTLVLTHFSQVKAIITDALHAVEDVVRDVLGFIRDYIMVQVDAVKVILSWFGRLGGLFRGWWDDAVDAVSTAIGHMMSFVRSIPGRIMGALAALPGELFSFGAHIISMLARGIASAVGDVTGAMVGIGSEILHHIPHSPAQKGPLSGSGDPTLAGRKIAQMLSQGMTSGLPVISAAAARMAGAASVGGRGYAAVGGGSGGYTELRVTGAGAANFTALIKAIWPDLKLEVRALGGGGPYSAQRALGSTWPRSA